MPPCAGCGTDKPKAEYSKNQYSKKDARRCKACVGAKLVSEAGGGSAAAVPVAKPDEAATELEAAAAAARAAPAAAPTAAASLLALAASPVDNSVALESHLLAENVGLTEVSDGCRGSLLRTPAEWIADYTAKFPHEMGRRASPPPHTHTQSSCLPLPTCCVLGQARH